MQNFTYFREICVLIIECECLKMKRRNLDKARQTVGARKAQVDAAMKANDEHTVCSMNSLAAVLI